MATTKAASPITPPKKAARVKTQVISIPADTLIANIKRFDNACSIIERLGLSSRIEYADMPRSAGPQEPMQRSVDGDYPTPSQDSVQQMVDYLADLASQVSASAVTIRTRILGQEAVKDTSNIASTTPSQGRIKDRIAFTRDMFYAIQRDLDQIATYTIAN